MWVFSKSGFYSVVRHRVLDDAWLVRARERGHLVELSRLCGWAGPSILSSGPGEADYPHRLVVTGRQLRAMMVTLAADVDYDNFKDACESVDKLRLLQVWRAMGGGRGDYNSNQEAR